MTQLPNLGTDYVVPTLGTLTLSWLHRLLASHPILTTSRWLCIVVTWWNCCTKWSCCHLMQMSLWHSYVINQQCRALPVLCHALIVLLLMTFVNVHVHPGPSTVASPNSDLCSDICFTNFCSLEEAYYLKWINWKCGFTVPIQMCFLLLRHG